MGLVLACQGIDNLLHKKKYQALKEEYYHKVREKRQAIEALMNGEGMEEARMEYLTLVRDMLKIALRELCLDLGYEIEFD